MRLRSSKYTEGEKTIFVSLFTYGKHGQPKGFQNILGHTKRGFAFGEAENLVVRPVETGVKVE